jgi:hypothetical protein
VLAGRPRPISKRSGFETWSGIRTSPIREVPKPAAGRSAGTLGAGLYAHDAICGRRGFELCHAPYDSRWSIALHADTMPEVDCLVSEAKTILANAGAKIAVEGLGSFASYWGQMISGPARNWIRPALIDTRQFGVLTTLSGFPQGCR